MKPFLYLIIAIGAILLTYLFITALNGGKNNGKSFQKKLADRKVAKTQGKTREQKYLEKQALKKAIAEKKAEWKKEDIEYDKQVKLNVAMYKDQVAAAKPLHDELYKAFKEDSKNPEKLAAYQANDKEFERIVQKLRIEKDRASVLRKIEILSKRGSRLRREIFVKRQYYYLVLPYTILFLIFTVLPVLMSLYFSFTYFNLLETPRWVGWENYMRLFVDDKVFIIALKNTAILAVIQDL